MTCLPVASLLALVLLTLGCAGTGGVRTGSDQAGDAASSDEGAADDPAKERAAAERAVRVAELELDQARLEAKRDAEKAQLDLDEARMEYTKAQRAMQAFDQARALELDKARLDVDRSTGRARDAELELAELEAMYADEEFAEKTKELVLTRGRRTLDEARRALALEERRLVHLTEVELPAQEHELKMELMSAKAARKAAQIALEVNEIETRLALDEAEEELRDARAKLDERMAEGSGS